MAQAGHHAIVVRCHGHHLHVAMVDMVYEVGARHFWHLYIGKQHVGVLCCDVFQRLAHVLRGEHLQWCAPQLCQHLAQQLQLQGIIVKN